MSAKLMLFPGETDAAATDRAKAFLASRTGVKRPAVERVEVVEDTASAPLAGVVETRDTPVSEAVLTTTDTLSPSTSTPATATVVPTTTRAAPMSLTELLTELFHRAPTHQVEAEIELGAAQLKLKWKVKELEVNKDEATVSFCLNTTETDVSLATGTLLKLHVQGRTYPCSFLLSLPLLKGLPWKRLVFLMDSDHQTVTPAA